MIACGGGGSGGGSSTTTSGAGTASYSVGGTATGVAGSGLMLQLNGANNLAVSGGPFSFGAELASGATYTVSVATQPSNPTQTCTVSNGTGTVAGANVTNVAVSCTTNTYSVGGNVSGLSGSLVLQDNGGDNLTISQSGPFVFATPVSSGKAYTVAVSTQPSNQTCTVSSGSGTVTSSNVTTVAVSCTSTQVTVGGTVQGLTGTGLQLQDNGGAALSIGASGSFTFPGTVPSGQPYAVTVAQQPTATPTQYCTVTNGSGTTAGANISNVTVTCRNQGQYLYVTTTYGGSGGSNPGGGMFTFFEISQTDGTLSLAHSYLTTWGLNPLGMALDSVGQWLYSTSEYSNPNVDGFVATDQIIASGGSAGQLADNGQPARNGSGTSSYSVALDPSAPYVFVGGTSSGPTTGVLYTYSASSGILTMLPGSPYPLGGSAANPAPGGDPYGLVVDPTGKFLYVATSDGGTVWGYSINADGSLATVSGSPFTFQAGGSTNTPYAIAVNPNGGYLYITDNTANTVTVYSYDPTSGALAQVGTPYPVGRVPESVTVDPTGQFLYVANSGEGSVSGFTINAANGALTAMSGSPFVTGGGSSSTPTAVAVEPSDQYAYVANGDAATITAFKIDPTSGVLTQIQAPAACPYGATCTVAAGGGTGGASAIVIE